MNPEHIAEVNAYVSTAARKNKEKVSNIGIAEDGEILVKAKA